MEKRHCGIYVHIPFCRQKCRYCDFLSAPGDSKCIREYVSALKNEIRSYKEIASEYVADTIYFGGGTPSILEPEFVEEIVGELKGCFDLRNSEEFTFEVNPGTVTPQKLKGYKALGINRLSVGVQSTDDEKLRLLGRIHNFKEAVECVEAIKESGFDNFSLDVISALPGQSIKDYERDLEKIIGLEPKHISSYSLIIEPGTPFFKDYGEGGSKRGDLPDEETDRKMYALTKEMLKRAGYERYEISNYAKPGFQSKHNSSYWTGKEYFGLGLGASSLVNNVRYSNVRDLKEYFNDPSKHVIEERLDKAALMAEFMILGLRMVRGVSKKEFEKRFETGFDDIYGNVLKKLKPAGVITEEDDTVRLTDYGLDVSNSVFEEFL
ncbi:MAG: radical SAM family heme chaperone HemW [Lachnospiraceae bacterium]|nr:radical SAM family heme chaperone HemW [Lachnospiraceae bacterium]